MDRSAKCVICGNDVPQNRKKYCCDRCRIKANILKDKERKQELRWVSKEVKCTVCGKPFMPRTRNHEFCSKDCHNAFIRGKKRLESLREKQNAPVKKRVCHTCGKPTDNYWCSSCWRKRAIQYGIPFRDVPGFWSEYHNGTR